MCTYPKYPWLPPEDAVYFCGLHKKSSMAYAWFHLFACRQRCAYSFVHCTICIRPLTISVFYISSICWINDSFSKQKNEQKWMHGTGGHFTPIYASIVHCCIIETH